MARGLNREGVGKREFPVGGNDSKPWVLKNQQLVCENPLAVPGIALAKTGRYHKQFKLLLRFFMWQGVKNPCCYKLISKSLQLDEVIFSLVLCFSH